MKRHVAILAVGMLTLAAGLLVTVKTADDANAAMRSFSPSRSFTTNRTFSNRTFSNKTFSNKSFTSRSKFSTSRTKFSTSKSKFNTSKFKTTKFNSTKFNKNKFGNINKFGNLPKGLKGPIGISSLGPKGLKGPIGLSMGPKALKGPFVNVVGPAKLFPKGPNITLINNRNFTIWRGPRSIWWNGRARTLVALAILGGVTIGGTYYLADGYVPVAYPICRGITEEGCQLVWRDVPTEDGDVIAQCVQFCPPVPSGTAVVVPPAAAPAAAAAPATAQVAAVDTRTAATPVPPGAMAQGCDMSIHAEPNFSGVNSEVTADQPQLSTYGWDKAIASINVKSGIWDFYTEENYGGQMIRLAPGQYPALAQGWDKTINSLMCAQP